MSDISDSREFNIDFVHFAGIVPPEILNFDDSAAAFAREYRKSKEELHQVMADWEAALSENKSKLSRAREEAICKKNALKDKVTKAASSLTCLKNDVEGLSSKCRVLEQVISEETENNTSLETFKNEIQTLLDTVVRKEMEKKKRNDSLLKERDWILSLMRLYKQCLDCHIEYCPPHDFIFSFEAKDKWVPGGGTAAWVRLKVSEDMKRWQLLEMADNPPCFPELADRLRCTNDVRSVIVDARKYYIPKAKN